MYNWQSYFQLNILWCALFVVFQAGASASIPVEKFSIEQLVVSTTSGDHEFQIELAKTDSQRRQGLQHRKSLSLNSGMLFVFEFIKPVTMWMKNTLVSLDMLFLSSDGRIINIVQKTNPLSLNAIFSIKPVKGVLEIRSGSVKKLKIKVGDRIRHPLFYK